MRWLSRPWVIVVVAIAFRLALMGVVWLPSQDPYHEHLTGNEPLNIAAHIVRGEGFASPYTVLPMPTAQQPPLYPMFLALIFKLFGVLSRTSIYVALVANAVAGGVAAWVLYRVGLRYFSLTTALFAAWMWALLPPVAFSDLVIFHYSFSALAILAWLWVIPNLSERLRNWIFLGFALGLALLLNPMLILVVPASALWFCNRKKHVVVMVAMALLAVVPWHVRNYRVLHRFYPALRDNLGDNLYLGNHVGGYEFPYQVPQFKELGEAKFMDMREHQAMDYIRAAPRDFFLRTMRRIAEFWLQPWPLVYFVLIGLAICGICKSPRPLAIFTLTLFALYPLVFYVTVAGWASYRHPIEPLLLLISAESVYERVIAHEQRRDQI
jgi:hypothetical protein